MCGHKKAISQRSNQIQREVCKQRTKNASTEEVEAIEAIEAIEASGATDNRPSIIKTINGQKNGVRNLR